MKTNWDLSECYSIAKSYLPEEKLNDLKLHILSIPWKFSLCLYHKEEYKRLIGNTATTGMSKELVEAVGKILEMSASTEAGKDFRLTLFFAEAHVIAYAQSLHSTADILAHIFKYVLDLDFGDKDINFSNALKLMNEKQIAVEAYEKAHGFRGSEEYKYLNAFVNTIKHRRLIEMPYQINLNPEQEFHGLKISSFRYGKDSNNELPYDSKWIDVFVGNDFKKLSNIIGEVVVALNQHMRLNLGPKP